MANAETLIRSVLKGAPLPWPKSASDLATEFLELTQFHGVGALLHHLLNDIPEKPLWPDEILAQLRQSAISRTAWEMAHHRVLSEIFDTFHEAGISPLILKGTALAYSHYPTPGVRERCDTDVLVAPEAGDAAGQILINSGFTKGFGVTGEVISYESAFYKTDGFGFTHTIDLHWRVNNAQVFARLFNFEGLLGRATRIRPLHELAMGFCPVDALLLACLHRAVHMAYTSEVHGQKYLDGHRLLWLYDIHLLLAHMADAELEEFSRRAMETGLGVVCLDALQRCSELLDSPVPSDLTDSLARADPRDPAARFLKAGAVERFRIELLAHATWQDRFLYLKELFFPSGEYMRRKYNADAEQPLLLLYVRRAWTGMKSRLSS